MLYLVETFLSLGDFIDQKLVKVLVRFCKLFIYLQNWFWTSFKLKLVFVFIGFKLKQVSKKPKTTFEYGFGGFKSFQDGGEVPERELLIL